MTWLLWRQHRLQALLSAALLLALAVVLWVTGVHMAHVYRAAVATCRTDGTCGNLSLFQGYGALFALVNLTIAAPLLFGTLWGAPLIGRELETGTHIVAWTQSITRGHWVKAKLAVLLAATAVASAALTAVVTWWSGTPNALDGQRFDPAHFETQGIVPVAYSLFAVSLGVTAGAVLRRSLPALGVTIFGYAAVRIAVDNYLRPHLLHPLSRLDPLGRPSVPDGAWVLSRNLTLNGHVVTGSVKAPAQCVGAASRPAMDQCLSGSGLRMLTSYQPASRYWTLQWLESSLFVALGALLILSCLVVMRHREA